MKRPLTPNAEWWGIAFWKWLQKLAQLQQTPWQSDEDGAELRLRFPGHFPHWEPTPLQKWLRNWGLVQSGLPLIVTVGLFFDFILARLSGFPLPDGAYIFIVLFQILLAPLLFMQWRFFLRSERRGALISTGLLFLLLRLLFHDSFSQGLTLCLFLALWLTGGVQMQRTK